MRPTFKKLEVKDISDLERLVAENVEGIEAGLKVIDSRLLLGQAAIDLVGLDARGALVLIALDFTADESLLLRMMDAYSWCLEYPDTIRRLYPVARVSAQRPPRILFIVERLTEAFLRRLKQLSVLEIDCLEFRHLEVNGTSALYFDLVQRLRKSTEADSTEAGPAATREPTVAASPQVPPVPAAAAPSTAVPPAPGTVASPASVTAAPAAIEPQATTPAVGAPPAPAPELVNGAASLQQHLAELVAAATATASEATAVATAPEQTTADPEWQALLGSLGVETPAPGAPAVEAAAAPGPVEKPEPVAPVEATAAPAPVVETQPTLPVWAKPADKAATSPVAGRTYFFAQAAKTGGPVEAASQAVADGAPEESSRPAPEAPAAARPAEPPPELDALNFPKDGLSRQWLEFLNQLGAAK
ncbi:MAG: hypothetical protein A3I17_10300 [Candidatus Rokubacteria bacterium RIFCSPLOWO2_02_FULL_72_37]|nr:MAG: hypothetical protein A3I17_10300 [Candidatus Rokubacteria bacterium RIFCSPLOWO2_02_FULL_72_37]